MFYVPNYSDYACVVMRDKDTIRAYLTQPQNNSDISYYDYFVNSHYLYNTGTQHFTLTATLPTCISSSNLTDNYYYRNDFSDICIIFLLFGIIIFGFPYKFLKTFRKALR